MHHWRDALANYNGGLVHDYDWALNGIDIKH